MQVIQKCADAGIDINDIQNRVVSMISCYEANYEANQNPNKKKTKTADGKIIMDNKDCYDRHSVFSGNVKCAELVPVLESYTYNNNKYTLRDDFKKDTTVSLKVRAINIQTPSNDWFVGVM
jgi:hypothetical protein